MVQIGSPTATVSNNWTVTSAASAHVALASASDTSLIETPTVDEACRVNITSLTDPVSSTGHIIKFRGQATGSGGKERVQVKLFEGSTERAASTDIEVTRGSFNAFSYTLDETETNSITAYTDLRIEVLAAVVGGTELLEVSECFLEIPDAPVAGAAILSSPINSSCLI